MSRRRRNGDGAAVGAVLEMRGDDVVEVLVVFVVEVEESECVAGDRVVTATGGGGGELGGSARRSAPGSTPP